MGDAGLQLRIELL